VAISLQSLVGCELEMQAQAFFLCRSLECNVLAQVIASYFLDNNVFLIMQLFDG